MSGRQVYYKISLDKRRMEGDFKYGMLGLGFISFLIGRFIYRVL